MRHSKLLLLISLLLTSPSFAGQLPNLLSEALLGELIFASSFEGGLVEVACPDPESMTQMQDDNWDLFYQTIGAIDPAGDIDFLTFPAATGEWYLIFTAQLTPIDTVITLFSPTEAQIARNDNGVPFQAPYSEVIYRAAATGAHCIRVEDRSTAYGEPLEGGPDYGYQATAVPLDFDAYEYHNLDTGNNDSTASPQTGLSFREAPGSFRRAAHIAGAYDSPSDIDVYELVAPDSALGMQVFFTPEGVDGYGGTATQGIVDILAADGTTVVSRMDYMENQRGIFLPILEPSVDIPEGADSMGQGDFALDETEAVWQFLYPPEDLVGLSPDDVISGISLRFEGDFGSATIADFKVTMGSGVENLGMTFADNFTSTPRVQFEGLLDIDDVPPRFGNTPWSEVIADRIVFYTGGSLLIEIRATVATADLHFDIHENPSDINNGQAVYALGNVDATEADTGPLPVGAAIRLHLDRGGEEPTFYLKLGEPQSPLGANPFYSVKWETHDAVNPQEEADSENNTAAGAETAQPIDLGFRTSHFLGGTMSGTSDTDWWSFEAETGDSIIVSCASYRNGSGVEDLTVGAYFDPLAAHLQQEIESNTADLLWSSDPAATQPPVTATNTGTHYLRISANTFSPEVTDRHYQCGIHVQ